MELIINSKKYGQHTVYYDDEDHELLSRFCWGITKGKNGVYYARSSVPNDLYDEFKCSSVRMHRLVMNATIKQIVDHIDYNGLNNTRKNLRIISNQENVSRRRLGKRNTTGYRGVFKYKRYFVAKITNNKKTIHLGYFKDTKEAAVAYNEAVMKYGISKEKLNKI